MTGRIPNADGRTVISSTTISKSDEWWMGVVRDRDPETGELRVRLERMTLDAEEGWKNIHTWRVRPEFWNAERKAVAKFQRGAGRTPPASTPVDATYTVTRYLKVRKDADRWVAVVELERPWGRPCTRLYHWRMPDETTCQKWTIGTDWTRARDLATRQLAQRA